MKLFTSATLIFVILSSFYFKNTLYSSNSAELILNVKNLNTEQIIYSLKDDFNKQPGVKFIDASLMTKTIILKVDNNQLEIATIEDLLSNWGCSIDDIDYSILNN